MLQRARTAAGCAGSIVAQAQSAYGTVVGAAGLAVAPPWQMVLGAEEPGIRAFLAWAALPVEEYGPGAEIKIETVGTEGGVDRDLHVLIEVDNPQVPGQKTWVEVPRAEWEGMSHAIFAEQTHGPAGDRTPEQAQHAADHQQVGGLARGRADSHGRLQGNTDGDIEGMMLDAVPEVRDPCRR